MRLATKGLWEASADSQGVQTLTLQRGARPVDPMVGWRRELTLLCDQVQSRGALLPSHESHLPVNFQDS